MMPSELRADVSGCLLGQGSVTRQSSGEVDDAEYSKRTQVQRDEQFARTRQFWPTVGATNNVASSHRQSRNPLDRPLHQRQVFSYLDGVHNHSINEESDIKSPSVLSSETSDWLVTKISGTRQSSGQAVDTEYARRIQEQKDEEFAKMLLFSDWLATRRSGTRQSNIRRIQEDADEEFAIMPQFSPIDGTAINFAGSHVQWRHSWGRNLLQRQGPFQSHGINEESDMKNPSVMSFETSDWQMTRRSGTSQSYITRTQEEADEEFTRMHQFSAIYGTTTNVAGSYVQGQYSLVRTLQQRQGQVEENEFALLDFNSYGSDEEIVFGMDRNDISFLPVHTYKRPTSGKNEDNKTCLVCLNEFKEGERLRTLPCCHMYHVDCIDEWLTRNAICPVCRQSAEERH